MKKTDVYVVVDTPKKAKKLKKILDMFGESYGGRTFELLENKEGDKVYFNMGSEWNTDTVSMIHRRLQEVSIKELRNIIASEYLKEGDVVVIKSIYNDDYWVIEVDTVEDYKAYHKHAINKSSGYKVNKGFLELNFIRYATEEEKALLEPKKELEVGKWYKGTCDFESLIFITEIENTGSYNNIHGYGFKWGQWNDLSHLLSNTDHEKSLVESTPQEVEQALIEEAKRRGFVNGGVGNNSNIHDKKLKNCELFFNNKYEYDDKDNLLRIILDADTTWTVFKDGQWANVIEQDKFTESDIAIVERLHDTILDNHGYSLESKLLTDARMLSNKIKSNIK